MSDWPFEPAFGLSVSPDGGRLAFMVNLEKGMRVLLILSTEGGTPREIYRGDDKQLITFAGAWTKDGKYVLVGSSDDREARLWLIPAAGGEGRKLDIAMESINQPAISSDGKKIAFTGGQTRSELWMIRNLFGESRAKQ